MLHNTYQKKWELRSSIRSRPRKPIDFEKLGNFFPIDKQLLFLLPEVICLDEQNKKEILIQSFYKYLNDIIYLEMKWIYSACNNIIHQNMIVPYDELTKLNAYTIIIDEYYHVYIAQDMIIQLKNAFPHIPQLEYGLSDSYNAVTTIKNKLDKKYHELFEIIAVCIFETTLVRELVNYFDSEDIHPSIKYYVNDHMNDESKHYGFFYDLLCYTWNNLPNEYQENIGIHLVDFIKLYLNINSEKSYNIALLASILKDRKKAENIIDNLYMDFVISTEIPTVKNVLNVLKKTGILDSLHVKHYFQINNLYI
jgi:hypothetical protein